MERGVGVVDHVHDCFLHDIFNEGAQSIEVEWHLLVHFSPSRFEMVYAFPLLAQLILGLIQDFFEFFIFLNQLENLEVMVFFGDYLLDHLRHGVDLVWLMSG
jgi:hypothetical protein